MATKTRTTAANRRSSQVVDPSVRAAANEYLAGLDPTKEVDPLQFIRQLWPKYRLSREQKKMVRSAFEDSETIVPAANAVGKDWVTSLIILVFFLTRNPCRIVLTSVNDKHLAVIWGELRRHIDLCAVALDVKKGGCLRINSERIRKILPDGSECKISYIVNMVCSNDTVDAMLGHHATPDGAADMSQEELKVPRTMAVTDESSGIWSEIVVRLKTWAKRLIMIGNCWPCDDYFRWAVEGFPGSNDKGGDREREPGDTRPGLARRVIRIPADTSPNVRMAQAQIAAGMKPTDPGFAPVLVPGMREYNDYVSKLASLDDIKAAAELHAFWYKGAALLLFPPKWLAHCEAIYEALRLGNAVGRALALGIDCAEGGDDFSMTAANHKTILEQISFKTPDTSVIIGHVKAFGRRHGVNPVNWVFDRGGGGYIHACELRRQGFPVRTLAFNNTPSAAPPKDVPKQTSEKKEDFEEKTVYASMRVELAWELSIACNPSGPLGGYGIPKECVELIRQLSVLPRQYGTDGTATLPSKNKKNKDSKEKTLVQMMGRSPDQMDSATLAYWGVKHRVMGGSAVSSSSASSNYSSYKPR